MNDKKNFIQGEINARKSLLADSDYKCMKFAEGSMTEEEFAPVREQRVKWREEINAYEKELENLIADDGVEGE